MLVTRWRWRSVKLFGREDAGPPTRPFKGQTAGSPTRPGDVGPSVIRVAVSAAMGVGCVTGPAARTPAESPQSPDALRRARRRSLGEQDSTCRASSCGCLSVASCRAGAAQVERGCPGMLPSAVQVAATGRLAVESARHYRKEPCVDLALDHHRRHRRAGRSYLLSPEACWVTRRGTFGPTAWERTHPTKGDRFALSTVPS